RMRSERLLGAARLLKDTARVHARLGRLLMETRASGRDPLRARTDLLAAAQGLDPYAAADEGWQAQSLVLLLRSMVVDLLQVAGADPGQARAVLPEL
ncbi:MAG: hypothetical protein KJ792_10060, partial [Actinobacteria bacterium]|nr:hypothetical protein [Actinomycetota bacterium]MCG2803017.1 hypothetical protein [Cellulomonas sp.]